jgi:hypothetical protein
MVVLERQVRHCIDVAVTDSRHTISGRRHVGLIMRCTGNHRAGESMDQPTSAYAMGRGTAEPMKVILGPSCRGG